jgi:predicted RND superfamily exporter protein
MDLLARWIQNRNVAWGIVLAVGLLTAAALLQARNLKNEDDLLAFLPQDNPDVKLFHDINERFGGLELAMVGIETEDPFDPRFLHRLQEVTQALKDDPGLDHVLSLTNVVDFTPDRERGGVITAPLVQHLPETETEQAALERKVMSRDHVVGNLISENGRAVLIYNFLTYSADPRTMAGRIQATVRDHFPDEAIYWAGNPFVSTYIYETTQRDLRRLTPWAVLAIVAVILLAFRDWLGATLALLTTGIGIAVTLGLMATFGVPFNIVLSAMPIILFAIGSAYGIHLLSRYYNLTDKCDSGSALRRTLKGIGPVVTAAGLTTVASLLSFVFMDIRPIRTFGFFTAVGILTTLVLSLTFIPAVVRLTNLKRKQGESLLMRKAMVRLTVFAQTHRLPVGLALLTLAGSSLFWVSQVNTSVDQTSFFAEDSPPARADDFMARHFGGGQFIQVFVEGDLDDPHVLRELRRIADRIAVHPRVTSVRHVADALALSNKAMVGQQRIPDTTPQVRMLYSFMTGDPAAAQLLSAEHDQGLIHIQVDSPEAEQLEAVLAFCEKVLAEELISDYRVVGPAHPRWDEAAARKRDMLTWRLLALADFYGAGLPADVEQQLRRFLQQPVPPPAPERLEAELMRFLGSEECAIDLVAELDVDLDRQPDPRRRVAEALAGLDALPDEQELNRILAGVLDRPADDLLVQDLTWSLLTPFEEAWRGVRASQQAAALIERLDIEVPAGGKGGRFVATLSAAFWDADNPKVLLPAEAGAAGLPGVAGVGGLKMQANGLPVLHRGLSRSVEANQIKSLLFAVLTIIVILSVLFRSVTAGLLAASPTLLTLAVIYGGMGLLRVHLDIGTSMLASIVLGVGVDYAVHLVAAWHPKNGSGLVTSAANAADHTGPAIWTNAIMIFCGFFVLTLGEARPLQNVGGLTAAAMLVAALATFLAIPVLARKRRYRNAPASQDELDSSEAVDAVLNKALPIKS